MWIKLILNWHLQILNAGAGLMACGIVEDLGAGIALARETQRSGRANALLDSWIYLSQVPILVVLGLLIYASCNAKAAIQFALSKIGAHSVEASVH